MILILFISSFQDSASLIAKTWVLSCLATHEATLTKMLLDEKSSPLCLRPMKSLLKCRGVSEYCFRDYTNVLGQKLFRTFHQCAYNNMMYAYIYIYIYIQSWKQCALPVITTTQWLCGNSSTWPHDVWFHITGANEPKSAQLDKQRT